MGIKSFFKSLAFWNGKTLTLNDDSDVVKVSSEHNESLKQSKKSVVVEATNTTQGALRNSVWQGRTKFIQNSKDQLTISWVYACINKIATTISSVPMNVTIGDNDDVRNWLYDLMKNPNDFQPRGEFWELATIYYLMEGNVIIYLQKSSILKRPYEMYLIHPDNVRPITNGKMVKWYAIFSPETFEYKVVSYRDIIHIKKPNAFDPSWGISALKLSQALTESEISANNFNMNSMEQGIFPPGAFVFEKELDDTEIDLIEMQIAERYSGSVNASVPLILGQGAKYMRYDESKIDAAFIQFKEMNRLEIAAFFDVPPPLIGIPDSSTYSNFGTALRMFTLGTIRPMFEKFMEAVNFTMQEYDSGEVYGDYNKVPIFKIVDDSVLRQFVNMFNSGVPVSHLEQMFDLGIPKFEGWDNSYVGKELISKNNRRLRSSSDFSVSGKHFDVEQTEDATESLFKALEALGAFDRHH